MRRTILVNARRGLGNRLRAVLSAQAYAEATGRRLAVLWDPNAQCGARWDDLFETPLPMRSILAARGLAAASGGWLTHLEADDFDLSPFADRRLIALHSSQPFSNPSGTPWWSLMARLTPTSEVRERVDAHWASLPCRAPRIGVMIRAHPSAHTETRLSRPVEYATARIAELRREFPEAVFIVSCDADDVVADLRSRFDRVSMLADKGPFNSRRGVQDALCDLYLVASCNWIVGSHLSSLSELAILLSGHEDGEVTAGSTAEIRTAAGADRIAGRMAETVRYPRELWRQP